MSFFFKRRDGSGNEGKRRISPPKVVAVSFLSAILVGSLLLVLPFSASRTYKEQSGARGMSYMDALFTATSATCVTGLIVKDTGKDFSPFGQLVILMLIQAGGLGIMTMSTFFLLLFGRRITLRDSVTVRTSLGERGMGSTTALIKYALMMTFTLEFLGTVILFWRLHWGANALGFGKAIYHAIFHAVSAFCNAGFSLYTTSLVGKEWPVVMTIAVLIILGGLGFIVLYNILNLRFWKKNKLVRGRLTLQSRVVLWATGIFVAAGCVAFLIFEWSTEGMAGQPFLKRLMHSFFCSVTPRTAGFNTIPYREMSRPGLLLTVLLMFIGGSPGSTAGGIKTCTFVVLLATAYAIVRGQRNVVVFKRTIPTRVVQEATAVVLIALLFVFAAAMALSVSERVPEVWPSAKSGFALRTTFEVMSAFGTVGLSTGITPHLSLAGKVIITITMFVGRIGPLALALVVAGREAVPSVEYPEEGVMIG
jgi:trk system potassium uptake protein TrkH